MTKQEMREFAQSQIEWYTKQVEWDCEHIQKINERLAKTRKEDKEMVEWAKAKYPNERFVQEHYNDSYKGDETKKLMNERSKYYREIKKYTARIAQYQQEVIKYSEEAQEATNTNDTKSEEETTMKKYFKVTFQYSEYVYCTNLAHAETAEDVEREYSKYPWQSVKEAQPWDVDDAKMKGMPIIEVEAAPTEEQTTDTEEEEEEETMFNNYYEAVTEDAAQYIRDNYTAEELAEKLTDREEFWEELNDAMWVSDEVTGNGSGSYTFDRAQAREYVMSDIDTVREALREFCTPADTIAEKFLDEDWEYFDVTARRYVLAQVIEDAIDRVVKKEVA